MPTTPATPFGGRGLVIHLQVFRRNVAYLLFEVRRPSYPFTFAEVGDERAFLISRPYKPFYYITRNWRRQACRIGWLIKASRAVDFASLDKTGAFDIMNTEGRC